MEAGGRHYIIHGSRNNVFRIWNLADLHLLNKACAESEIDEDVEEIKNDPFSFWIGGGDYAEYIGPRDRKRWDPDAVSEKITVADLGRLGKRTAEIVRDKFKPIAHKCIGLVYGNHEDNYMIEKSQQELHSWLCQELGVLNLGYCALFDIAFVRSGKVKIPYLSRAAPTKSDSTTQYIRRCFIHHGTGFATTPAGKLNKLLQFMDAFEADIYFCGHVHDQIGKRQNRITANEDCTKILAQDKIGVISGSYLKTYQQGVTTYGEKKGYRPTVLRSAYVRIDPEQKKVWGEI